jgi:hypothetical protein
MRRSWLIALLLLAVFSGNAIFLGSTSALLRRLNLKASNLLDNVSTSTFWALHALFPFALVFGD